MSGVVGGDEIAGRRRDRLPELEGAARAPDTDPQPNLVTQHAALQLDDHAITASLPNARARPGQHAQGREPYLARTGDQSLVDVSGRADQLRALLRESLPDEPTQLIEQLTPSRRGAVGRMRIDQARSYPAGAVQDAAEPLDGLERAIEALDRPALDASVAQLVAAQFDQDQEALQRVAELMQRDPVDRLGELELRGQPPHVTRA